MNDGVSFVAFSLSLIGALVFFCGGAFALAAMDKSSPNTKMAVLWRCAAQCQWSRLIDESLKVSLNWLSRIVRLHFEEADKRPLLDVLTVGLVIFLIPILASLNALLGGSPFLFKAYLIMIGGFALLGLTSQLNRNNSLVATVNGGLALVLGLGLFLGSPLYVLTSFSGRILHENISHAFLLSLLIAPFYYVAASSTMNFIELFCGKNPTKGRSPSVVFFRRFLAALPVSFILVFLALLLGQLAIQKTVPTRTVQMLLVSTTIGAFSLPAAICALSPFMSGKGLIGSLPTLLNGLVTAMGLSIALLYFSYLSTPNEVSLAQSVNILFALDESGKRIFLGPDFWVMHIPFVPVFGVLSFSLFGVIAKILTQIPGLPNRPYLAMAGLFGVVGIGLFICGRLLDPSI